MLEIQRRFQELGCFACGRNDHGLKLVFEETSEGARTRFRLPEHFQSYPGFLHGGILCAVLDETMAYAGVLKHRILPFTKSLAVNYRKAVPGGVEHECASRLVAWEGSRFQASAEIGGGLVTATAEFVVPTLAMARRMLPGTNVEAFAEFFRLLP